MAVSKKTSVRKSSVASVVEETNAAPLLSKINNKKLMWPVAAVLVLVIIGALAYNFRSLFLAASVNGKLVTRFELDRELEKQTGKDTLENVITKQLILQEAQKQNISVPDSEVDTKLADIEKQVGDKGAKLDELLAAQGQTRDSLKEQLMLQVLIEKLVGKDITVTDDEVTGYFTKNAASYPKGTTLDSVKETIKSQLNQQKLSEKVNTWIQDLRAQAKVEYFIKF